MQKAGLWGAEYIVLYCILRNPRNETSDARWSNVLPILYVHGEMHRCVDIQARYNTKE